LVAEALMNEQCNYEHLFVTSSSLCCGLYFFLTMNYADDAVHEDSKLT
jgi:hypothetical protein